MRRWLRLHRGDVVGIGCFLLVMVFCVTLIGLRSTPPTGDAPTPSPSGAGSPSASRSLTPAPTAGRQPEVIQAGTGPLLPGGSRGTVYAQALTAIYRLELGTGRIIRTPTPALEQHASFVAGNGQVIFKSIGFPPSTGSQLPNQGALVVDDKPAAPLPPGLDFSGRLYPGPNGDLWSVPEVDGPPEIATRYSFTGRPQASQTLVSPAGYALGDAAGSLLLVNAAGVYQLSADGPRYLTRGVLLAIGRHHLLVWDCDRNARCQPYSFNRAAGQRIAMPRLTAPILRLNMGEEPASSSYGVGDLSSDGTHVALISPTGNGDSRINVINLDRGAVHPIKGATTDVNPNTQSTWTPDSRWLLTLTDHRLRAYDTTTSRTRTLKLTSEDLLHLTMTGASGN